MEERRQRHQEREVREKEARRIREREVILNERRGISSPQSPTSPLEVEYPVIPETPSDDEEEYPVIPETPPTMQGAVEQPEMVTDDVEGFSSQDLFTGQDSQVESDIASPELVEIHLHLDGAIRPSTIWDLSHKRDISVECSSLEELERELVEWKTGDLSTFLSEFGRFMPAIVGSLEAAKRISYELCEDMSKQGVVYFEARYSPQLLANTDRFFRGPEGDVTLRDIVKAVNEGIREGEKDFGVKARTVLCMIRDKPEWSADVLELAKEFRNDTVVGVDLANNEMLELFSEHIAAFKGAEEAGIHRTCHAGEMGPASNVQTAIEVLHAERIGHGYHVFDDESVVKLAKEKKIHFEVCPTSSTRTGALPNDFDCHCAKRFLSEGMNISLNTDDPTLFGTTLITEFSIARKHFGMDDKALALMTLNTARATFLPDEEKVVLVRSLEDLFKDILHPHSSQGHPCQPMTHETNIPIDRQPLQVVDNVLKMNDIPETDAPYSLSALCSSEAYLSL